MADIEVVIRGVNTENQTASVKVDGVEVDNVRYVSISNWSYDGTPSFHFSVDTFEKVGDVSKTTTLYASKRENSKASLQYPGLFEEAGEASKKTQTLSLASLAEKVRKSKEA